MRQTNAKRSPNRKTTCFGIEKLLGFLHFHDKTVLLCRHRGRGRIIPQCCSPSRRHCDVIVHDVGQMPDLSTSPVSPNMQNPNVSVYLKPWRECRCCNKYYLNEFAVDIASNFDSFVRGKYPDDTQLQVEACYLKLRALYLYFMFERLTLTAEQKRKREVGSWSNCE